MDEKQIPKILQLIEEETRYEIIARLVPMHQNDFTCYANKQIEKKDELRKLVFGSSCLVELGMRWGILEQRSTKKHKPKSKQTQPKRPTLND